MAEETDTATPQKPFLRRGEDFESLYANNVHFQPSEWDLKLIFGELDQDEDGAFVEQHTSISIPWLQAKLMSYFLTLQVGAYELSHQTIPVPPTLLPPDAVPLEGEFANDPYSKKLYDYIKKAREAFVASVK